jgi:hypothetical protein
LVNATYDGNAFPPSVVVPSALEMMTGRPASRIAAAELLVPRSIPMIFALGCCSPDPRSAGALRGPEF